MPELTLAKYDYGSTYYEALIQENYLFDEELAELTTLQQKINEMVILYKSLGGGWKPIFSCKNCISISGLFK